MRSTLNWFLTLVLAVLFLAGAMLFQNHMIERFYREPEKYRDSLYVPSEGYLRVITVGYRQFFADFFWLRMIQTFAAGWSRPENVPQMHSYFQGITDLDPKFLDVYSFGMMAMGQEGRRDDLAQDVVIKSVVKVPGNWKIPSEGAAYFAITAKKDIQLAKLDVRLALASPNHPIYIENWPGYFDIKEGRYRAAYEKYMVDYIQALIRGQEAKSNPEILRLRRVHLERAVVEWFKGEIHQRAMDWQERTSQTPTLEQLEQAGAFRGVQLPDWTEISAILGNLESSSEVKPLSPDEIRGLIQRFIKTWDHLPPAAPHDAQFPKYPGFAILIHSEKDKPFEVLEKSELLRTYQDALAQYEERLPNYQNSHNGACPSDVSELIPWMKGVRDPLGGEFRIDPRTCALTFTSVPDIRDIAIPVF